MRLVKSKRALWLVAVVFLMVVGFGTMRSHSIEAKSTSISISINGVDTPWKESFSSSCEYYSSSGYLASMSTSLSTLTGLSDSYVVSTVWCHEYGVSNQTANDWCYGDGLVKSRSGKPGVNLSASGSGLWSNGITSYQLTLKDDRAFVAYMKDENTKITCKWPKLENGVWNWTEPSAPTAPEGKKFKGWSTRTDYFEAAPTPGGTRKFDGIVYAYFVDKEAIFTWDLNGADEGSRTPDPITITKSQIDSYKANSDLWESFPNQGFWKTGHKFQGWSKTKNAYSSGSGTIYGRPNVDATKEDNLLERAKAAFQDHTYYAQWGVAATVKWHNNYGDGACNKDDRCSSENVEEKKGGGGFALVETPTAGRAGYTLKGWSRDPDATKAEYQPDGALVSVTTDTEFYAVWEKVDYSITFRSETLAAESEPLPEKITGLSYGDNVNLSFPKLLRRRYIFAGWRFPRPGNPWGHLEWTSSRPQLTVSDDYGGPAVSLEAIWYDAPQASVLYRYYDTSVKTFVTQTFYRDGLDDAQTVPGSPMAKTGLEFKGWTKVYGSTNVDFEKGDSIKLSQLGGDSASYELWAVYDYAPRKIVFTKGSLGDKVKGDLPDPIENLTVGTQAEIPELKGSLLLAEKVFGGWTDDTEKPLWRAGDKVSITAEIPTTYNLKPKWNDAPTAVLRYDTNGGSGWENGPDGASYITAKTQKFDGIYDDGKYDKPVIQTATPKKAGYTFAGWSREKDGEVVYKAGDVVDDLTEGEDRTIYAKWEPKKYTIFFDKNGDDVVGEPMAPIENLIYNQTVEIPGTDWKRPGKVFKGWVTSPTGTIVNYTAGSKMTLTGASNYERTFYAGVRQASLRLRTT